MHSMTCSHYGCDMPGTYEYKSSVLIKDAIGSIGGRSCLQHFDEMMRSVITLVKQHQDYVNPPIKFNKGGPTSTKDFE